MYCIDGAFFMFHYLVIFSLVALCFSFAQLPMPTTADCSTAISISCGDSLRINTSNYPIVFVDNCFRWFTRKVWFSFVGDGEVHDFTYSTTLNDEAGNADGPLFDFKLSCPNSQVAQLVENSIPTLGLMGCFMSCITFFNFGDCTY